MNEEWGCLIGLGNPSIALQEETTTIGRVHQTCLKTQTRISSSHCVISHVNLPAYSVTNITDTSSNGTFLNCQRLNKNVETTLSSFDFVQFLDSTQKEVQRYIFYEKSAENSKFLKNYEFENYIGAGSFGVVYSALNKITKDLVAIKIISKSKAADSLELLRRESATMKTICHIHVVAFHQEVETETHFFIVMEYVPGVSLEKVFESKLSDLKLSDDQKILFLHDFFELMRDLHAKNIVHRDLKPENIKIEIVKQKYVTFKLMDFGFGKEAAELTTTLCGTPMYVAVEVYTNAMTQGSHPYNAKKVDVWSAGVIAYQLITGKHPFIKSGECVKDFFNRAKHSTFVESNEFKLLDDNFKELFKEMLCADPEKRPTFEQCLKLTVFGRKRECERNEKSPLKKCE
ncbi:ovarian-specific serine/threonine protein kinase Lok, putative [Entamoeba invadens IP1]|uniref:Ovarian-specific serine/threonine protein kinase Lok, putative n=1 Tax=Entamoeba invadens IP1 TaxID=370355 RepID=A0A0A1U1S1_ENTIV|nr:ovarian-specific serine/threonine protein kinase Lok, putative [Entamoeba invadens IP1]ELP86562.1 ovarian-specific serine/threonine protein kinase Lok, putative [Entamoeba invadens IP1]|eukprot:XP_004185908.1 ovarian-specific serine/threonine protein kinase Lok, putative [Entamoeba invadens IP1]